MNRVLRPLVRLPDAPGIVSYHRRFRLESQAAVSRTMAYIPTDKSGGLYAIGGKHAGLREELHHPRHRAVRKRHAAGQFAGPFAIFVAGCRSHAFPSSKTGASRGAGRLVCGRNHTNVPNTPGECHFR